MDIQRLKLLGDTPPGVIPNDCFLFHPIVCRRRENIWHTSTDSMYKVHSRHDHLPGVGTEGEVVEAPGVITTTTSKGVNLWESENLIDERICNTFD